MSSRADFFFAFSFEDSVCCLVFSIWGFIMLLVLGSLLSSNYTPVHLETLNATSAAKAASGAYAAAGVYGGLIIICAVRFAYIMWSTRRNQVIRV